MSDLAQRRRVLIMGAAGRDFHNFLCCYREDPHTAVVAFTAAQIPSIAEHRYPASLAGPSYPDGIPMYRLSDSNGEIWGVKESRCQIFLLLDGMQLKFCHLRYGHSITSERMLNNTALFQLTIAEHIGAHSSDYSS